MNEQTSESLRAWFRQLEGIYPELFNTAHAICGNYTLAENALRSAIVDVWSQNNTGGMGFRERLRHAVRAEAFDALSDGDAASPAEFTWPGFPQGSSDALTRLASRERIETQRVLMLRHGVGLPVKRIAQLTGATPSQVRTTLNRFESRGRRSLPAQDKGRFDALFQRSARQALSSRAGIPHPSTAYRAFEAEASGMQVSSHRVSRVVYRVLVLVMALVCAAMFWLFAVLVQSPSMEQAPAESPEPTLAQVAEPTAEPTAGPDFMPAATSITTQLTEEG